jgi:hypothetical protein
MTERVHKNCEEWRLALNVFQIVQFIEFGEASARTFSISDATLLEKCPFNPTAFNASNVLESAFFKASLNCSSIRLFRQRGLSMNPVGSQGRYLL